MNKETVVLVHGFFKGPGDMKYLKQGLEKAGFATFTPDLPTTLGSLEECAESLGIQLARLKEVRAMHFVAHSMGGLITRVHLSRQGVQNVGRCVFIATPHRGTDLAGMAGKIPFYCSIFKPLQAIQPDNCYQRFRNKEQPGLGIIAGSRNCSVLGKCILKGPSDGRVEVFRAEAEDADEFIVLPYGHKDIHHQEQTLVKVIQFLRNGSFESVRETASRPRGRHDSADCQS